MKVEVELGLNPLNSGFHRSIDACVLPLDFMIRQFLTTLEFSVLRQMHNIVSTNIVKRLYSINIVSYKPPLSSACSSIPKQPPTRDSQSAKTLLVSGTG